MNAKILVSPLVILFLLSGGMAWAEAEEDHPKRVTRTVKKQGDQESKVREVSRRVTRVQENRREDHGPRGERDQMRGPRGRDPRGPMRPMAGRVQSARQHRGIPGREQGAWGRAMQGARWQGRGMPSHVSGRRSGTHPWAQQMRMRTVMQQRGARGASASRPAWQIIAYRNGWRPNPTASQGRPSVRGPQRATRGPRRPGPSNSQADRTPPNRDRDQDMRGAPRRGGGPRRPGPSNSQADRSPPNRDRDQDMRGAPRRGGGPRRPGPSNPRADRTPPRRDSDMREESRRGGGPRGRGGRSAPPEKPEN